jgi:branched-chain amino acid transport system substrate-binding protein
MQAICALDKDQGMGYNLAGSCLAVQPTENPHHGRSGIARSKVLVVTLVTTLLLSSALAACGPAGRGTIKIAIVASLSGDMATAGDATKKAAELAFQEWNETGGVLGKTIQWVVANDYCDPQEARNAASKVVNQDRVRFIVGGICPDASVEIAQVANANQVLLISPAATDPRVTVDNDGNIRPYIFQVCLTNAFQGTVMANFALQTLGAKTAAVLLDPESESVRTTAESFRDAFTAGGGSVVVWETYAQSETDFSTILAEVLAAKPDFLFLPDRYSTVNLIARQARGKGITAVIGGGDGWDADPLDVQAVDGGFYVTNYDKADPRPSVQEWVKKYRDKYGSDPDTWATLAYEATNMLLTAIKSAGSADPDKVKAVLESSKFNGVSGEIAMDKSHQAVKNAVIIAVKDGQRLYQETVAP